MSSHTDDATTDRGGAMIVRGEDVSYEPVTAADGLSKGVFIDESDGAPNFALRRFELAPGADVPRHTNSVEHEQFVLAGEYVVTLDGEEHTVSAGDAVFVPAGAVHSYRNPGDEPGAFICVVPNGDDSIDLVE